MCCRILNIKGPDIRSEYSHPLLQEVESRIDDFRDKEGDKISYEEFDNIIADVSKNDPTDRDLLSTLSFENFINTESSTTESQDRGTQLEVAESYGMFPDYTFVLNRVTMGDEWWVSYDPFVHESVEELFNDILNEELALTIGEALLEHEASFDETSNIVPRLALFVLKVCVPCREESKYQNSVYCIERAWAESGILES